MNGRWQPASKRCYTSVKSAGRFDSMIVLYTTERDYPWGTLRSSHASKTKVVLEEKRVRYRIENLRPGDLWKKPPEMLARHPLGKVPYIEDEGVTIFDSTVIDEYLDDRYGPPRLLPEDRKSTRLNSSHPSSSYAV